jgi:putative FmdB family regulatory protein
MHEVPLMPNYDYKCNVCGGVQEIYQQFGDSTVPVCCQQSMSKIFQATPAVFKGGGWGGQ